MGRGVPARPFPPGFGGLLGFGFGERDDGAEHRRVLTSCLRLHGRTLEFDANHNWSRRAVGMTAKGRRTDAIITGVLGNPGVGPRGLAAGEGTGRAQLGTAQDRLHDLRSRQGIHLTIWKTGQAPFVPNRREPEPFGLWMRLLFPRRPGLPRRVLEVHVSARRPALGLALGLGLGQVVEEAVADVADRTLDLPLRLRLTCPARPNVEAPVCAERRNSRFSSNRPPSPRWPTTTTRIWSKELGGHDSEERERTPLDPDHRTPSSAARSYQSHSIREQPRSGPVETSR